MTRLFKTCTDWARGVDPTLAANRNSSVVDGLLREDCDLSYSTKIMYGHKQGTLSSKRDADGNVVIKISRVVSEILDFREEFETTCNRQYEFKFDKSGKLVSATFDNDGEYSSPRNKRQYDEGAAALTPAIAREAIIEIETAYKAQIREDGRADGGPLRMRGTVQNTGRSA